MEETLNNLVYQFMTKFFIDLHLININGFQVWKDVNDVINFYCNVETKVFRISFKNRKLIMSMFNLTDVQFDNILKKWAIENLNIEISCVMPSII